MEIGIKVVEGLEINIEGDSFIAVRGSNVGCIKCAIDRFFTYDYSKSCPFECSPDLTFINKTKLGKVRKANLYEYVCPYCENPTLIDRPDLIKVVCSDCGKVARYNI